VQDTLYNIFVPAWFLNLLHKKFDKNAIVTTDGKTAYRTLKEI
jgi:hypothetical protein